MFYGSISAKGYVKTKPLRNGKTPISSKLSVGMFDCKCARLFFGKKPLREVLKVA